MSPSATTTAFAVEVRTVAGSTSGLANGMGTAALFSATSGAAVGVAAAAVNSGGSTLYLADAGNGAIRALDTTSFVATTLASGLAAPLGVAISADGAALYVAAGTLCAVAVATGAVTTLAGGGPLTAAMTAGAATRGGVGTNAVFGALRGVAVAGGTVYLSDAGFSDVVAYNVATGAVANVAGGGAPVPPTQLAAGTVGAADGMGTAALFSAPWGLCADGAGRVFVADSGNGLIRTIVVATGVVTTLAGGGMGMALGVGAASFRKPTGVALDVLQPGRLAVTDATNEVVRSVDIATGAVSLLGGPPTSVQAGASVDGFGDAARFGAPLGIAVSPFAYYYVTDSATGRVRAVTNARFGASTSPTPSQTRTPSNTPSPSSTPGSNNVIRFAGGLGSPYAPPCTCADGIGTNAGFIRDCLGENSNIPPLQGAHLVNGTMWIADTNGNLIRRLDMATRNVTTVAGGWDGNPNRAFLTRTTLRQPAAPANLTPNPMRAPRP